MIQNNGVWTIRERRGERLFRVVLAGDICPQATGETVRREEILRPLLPFLRGADLRIVQWETPIAEREAPIPKSGPNLNCRPEMIDIIRAAGFQVALLANNHIGDHGPEAVLRTIELLRNSGIQTVGAGENLDAAERPLEIRAGGKTIRILNFCEHEFGTAEENFPGSAPIRPFRNCEAIRKAAACADFVLVALHGGHEFNPFPSPRLQELCRVFADAGADLVFNCHTHCPEGAEVHNGTPILYSPGNFYFPKHGQTSRLWNCGFLIAANFDTDGVYELEFEPYSIREESVTPLEEGKRKEFFRYLEELSEPLSDPHRMQKLFESWSSRYGKNYFEGGVSALPENWKQTGDPDVVSRYLGFRNIFTCESHNDMVRCYLKLVEEHRLPEAGKLLPRIESLQNPEWVRE